MQACTENFLFLFSGTVNAYQLREERKCSGRQHPAVVTAAAAAAAARRRHASSL